MTLLFLQVFIVELQTNIAAFFTLRYVPMYLNLQTYTVHPTQQMISHHTHFESQVSNIKKYKNINKLYPRKMLKISKQKQQQTT